MASRRVLPALVDEPERGAPPVFDEAVAVDVARSVDPGEGGQGVRPEPVDECVVAGPIVGLAEQDQPERSRVDAAVVRREGQLAGPGHLPGPDLVQDLAGLGVRPRVVDDRLACGEDLQGRDGQVGPEGDRLVGADDRIAAEQGGEPWHAGREIALSGAWPVVEQQAQVGHAPLDEPVEQFVVRFDRRHPGPPGLVGGRAFGLVDDRRRTGRQADLGRIRRGRGIERRLIRPDRPAELHPATWLDVEPPAQDQGCPRHPLRLGQVEGGDDLGTGEGDLGPADHPVPAEMAERDPFRTDDHVKGPPCGVAVVAADLEDVGRVRPERQVDPDRLGMLGEVRHRQVFAEGTADDPRPGKPERLAGERPVGGDLVPGIVADLGIGQLDRAPVVLVDVAAQEGRPGAVDAQDRAGQDPRVAAIQAEAARVAMDVAEGIGQQVEVAVLEDSDAAEVRRMDDHALGGNDAAKGRAHGRHAPSLSSRAAAAATIRPVPLTKGSHACRSSS